MKTKIDAFLIRLLKENLLYAGAIVMVVLLSFFSVSLFISNLQDVSAKSDKMKQDLGDLNKKIDIIKYSQILSNQSIDISQLNKNFAQLLPSSEDYFSIVAALERISARTGFIITNYQINLSKKTPAKLSITVTGAGDTPAFLRFLKDYNFSGGRLITIDKINFADVGYEEIKLNMNFYTSKGNASSNKFAYFTESDKDLIKRIQDKVVVNSDIPSTTTGQESTGSVDYDTKQNPF